MILLIEQVLNGIQFGIMLFLIAAGLSLIFGTMGVINLAHGSVYMIGAYAGTYAVASSGSFLWGGLAALATAAVAGAIIEALIVRRLYGRDHLDQVLATFALILICNQLTVILFGRQPLFVSVPALLDGSVTLLPGLQYPVYRLITIGLGLFVALGLYVLINKTRVGMLVRAGSTHREMVRALGVNIRLLYTLVFGLGALLAGFAGFMVGPISSVQVGMGEQILITAFVVVVVGGVGSVRGAFVASLVIGIVDTLLRSYAPTLLRRIIEGPDADALGAGLSSMGIYLLMALVLLVRPRGLFATSS